MGSLSVERDQFKKICSDQEERILKLEASMDKAREYILGLKRHEAVT
jgi:bacterioferritin (cytochrome b1)